MYTVTALDKETAKRAWAAKNMTKESAIECATENAILDNFYIDVLNEDTNNFLLPDGTEQRDCKFWNKL